MNPINPSLGKPIDIYSAIENLIQQNSAKLRCHTYSIVTAVDTENKTINAQPLCQEFRNTPEGKEPVNLPEFKGIKYFGTPEVNDLCILLHLDRTINIEQNQDGFYKPAKRYHYFSDVIALCDYKYKSPVGIVYFDKGVLTNGALSNTATMLNSYKIKADGEYIINCWTESQDVTDSSITSMYIVLESNPAALFTVRYFLNNGGGACGNYAGTFNKGDNLQLYVYNGSSSAVKYRYMLSVTRIK